MSLCSFFKSLSCSPASLPLRWGGGLLACLLGLWGPLCLASAQPAPSGEVASTTFTLSGSTTGGEDEGGGTMAVGAKRSLSSPNSPFAARHTSAMGQAAGDVVISEFRFSGPGGNRDEYIELYNMQGAPLDLTGWTLSVSATNSPLSALDLTGKTIPAYGHLLLTNSGQNNSGGYSLSAVYPATYPVNSTTPSSYATGDVSYTGDIALSSALTLSNAQGTVIDSVGDLSGASGFVSSNQYAFVRRMDGALGLIDTDTDQNDFNLLDTASTNGSADVTGLSTLVGGARLGTPGPQNTSAPVQRAALSIAPLDPAANGGVTASGRYASRGSNADPLGRLTLRRTITNFSNTTLTQIRIFLVRTTSGACNDTSVADMRAITSVGASLNGTKYVQGIQLEAPTDPTTPSNQLSSSDTGNGGGLNASWNVGTLPAGGLAPGASMNIEFVFGIKREGNYNFSILIQVLPGLQAPTPTPAPTATPAPSLDASIRSEADASAQWQGQNLVNSTGAGQEASQRTFADMTATYAVSVRRPSTATSGQVNLTVPSYAAFATNGWSARFFVGTTSQEITSAITSSAGWNTALAAGGEVRVRMEVSVPPDAASNSIHFLPIQAQDASGATPATLDCVEANVLVDAPPTGPYLKRIEWSTDGTTWHPVGGASLSLLKNHSFGLRAVAYDPKPSPDAAGHHPWEESLEYIPTWSVKQAGHLKPTIHLGEMIWVQGTNVGTLTFSASAGHTLSGSTTVAPDPEDDDEEDATP